MAKKQSPGTIEIFKGNNKKWFAHIIRKGRITMQATNGTGYERPSSIIRMLKNTLINFSSYKIITKK